MSLGSKHIRQFTCIYVFVFLYLDLHLHLYFTDSSNDLLFDTVSGV